MYTSGNINVGIGTANPESNASQLHIKNRYLEMQKVTEVMDHSEQVMSAYSTKIETGATKAEAIDTGSDGHVKITTRGNAVIIS